MRFIGVLLLVIMMAFPVMAATVTATIANGASLSSAVNIPKTSPQSTNPRSVAIIMPAAWTTANLTFFVSADGVNYTELYDGQGNEYTVVAAASRYILLDPAVFTNITNFEIQSGTTGSPVNQGAARTLTVTVN